jgi:large subunit ribosomal protein L10
VDDSALPRSDARPSTLHRFEGFDVSGEGDTMDKAGKNQILGEIKESFADVQSIIVVDYRGITVPVVTALRDDFRKASCHYRVLKNSLVKIAVKGSKMEPLATLMSGTTAVIWSNESAQAPAKLALKWAKDEPKFQIKGGYFDGKALDAAGVDSLAKMPGKPEIQASLLMTFLAAPTDFVRQIAAAPQNFVYLVDARKRALESA